MIQIISGEKGEGKTKHLIDMANTKVKETPGHIVYLNNDREHMYQLHYKIRFIVVDDFPVKNSKEFLGFICGIIAQDHDIDHIYIDGLLKMTKLTLEEAYNLIEELRQVGEKFNVNFVIGMSCRNKDIPESLKSYLIA